MKQLILLMLLLFGYQLFASDFGDKLENCKSLDLDRLASHNEVKNSFYVNKKEDTQWIKSGSDNPSGVAIVVHGLNTKPSAMNDIVEVYTKMNFAVLRVSLNGHRGDIEEFLGVSRGAWLNNIFHAYCLAKKKADPLNLPLHFVGYSLGAVMGMDFFTINSAQKPRVKRVVLFAPPIEVRLTSRFVKIFNVLGTRAVVPSFSPREYRANYGTPIVAYNALFEAVEAFKKNFKRELINIPTLIIVDKKDELVSFSGIEKLIKKEKLSKWRIVAVDSKASYRHLVIDKKSLGKSQWEMVEREIKRTWDY